MTIVKKFLVQIILVASTLAVRAEILPPGNRPLPPGVHALTGAKVFIKPGEVLESATILIRDGLIEKVGKDVAIPADARVWDMKGTTIYAGFIDSYLTLGATGSTSLPAKKYSDVTTGNFFGMPGAGYEISLITPERRVVDNYAPDAKVLEKMREIGFTTANIVPEKGILRGTSAFVALSETDATQVIIKPDVSQHIVFNKEGGKEDAYPESLMGIIATVRQSFFDAQHYALDRADYQKNPARKRPAFNPASESLAPALNKKMRVVFEPESALMVERAAQVAAELNLDFALVSSGQEWRRPELAKATKAQFIVPLNFPELPKFPDSNDWTQVTLDQLRAWDWAPENAALLRQQGLEIALTTHGLAEKKNFRKNLKTALERGLSENDALAALTTIPAKLCGMENLLGTIEAGKLANLTIVGGTNYFEPETKVRAVWIEGRHYRASTEETKTAKVEEKKPAEVKTPEEGDPTKPAPEKEKELAKNPKEEPSKDELSKKEKEKKDAAQRELSKKRVAHSPQEGRGPITNAQNLFIKNATIWTSGTNGILTNASILISGGKIQNIGMFKAELAANTFVIDAAGMHVTPGLIDCHSHAAILGDVNEGTLPSTSMVRIGDVVNSETDNIYNELAGGLTVANLLHGSANPIGGQNQVIKLRDGATPEGLKFEGAISGIKFALGENVKQSNWGEKHVTRFPQTRMGVRTFFSNRFTAAQQYLKKWETYRAKVGQASSLSSAQAGKMPALLPPQRDLELEALGEIIQGKRLIHCHSYRQDEILMTLRLMQSFGVQIGTFQHVLEGYKVADELAAGNVGASTFADWWAYKFEVYDAIPFNGSLMRDRGVLVSFNSDSGDLARRLNTEAAKAVKFGGTPEIEALKFVTINPAKQLRIDNRVGSLEVGKDADFVVWSKSPLDSETVCLQTWIDGKKYFDRALSTERAAALDKERNALIEKAKKILKVADASGDKPDEAGKKKFFELALEHLHDSHDRHCDDD